MRSVYGRRKHNHFVPDGYVPPKSRQKIFVPPSYAKMLKGGGTSPSRPVSLTLVNRVSPRNVSSAPGRQNQSVLPYAEFSRPPSRPDSRVDTPVHALRMLKNLDSPRTPVMVTPPSPSPSSHPGILKSTSPFTKFSPPPPRGILKSTPPLRGILKSNTPPRVYSSQGILQPYSPRTPQAQQYSSISPQAQQYSSIPSQAQQYYSTYPQGHEYVDMGGDEDMTPPSRQSGPAPKSSQSSYGPISVVDKYDTPDTHNLWRPQYPAGRVSAAKSARGRPRMRHPNIIFGQVVDAQDDGGAACRSSSEDEDEDEEEDADCCKIYNPCAPPLDWDRDPTLQGIEREERQAYRQYKLEGYVREVCARSDPPERFESYLIRCYALANGELNAHASKHILGYVDEHLSPLDVWVLRLCRGTVSRLARMGTVYPDWECELFLRLLREECVALHAARGSLLRRHLNETERRVHACNAQERNYKKILLLSQRSPMGVMQHLRRCDYR